MHRLLFRSSLILLGTLLLCLGAIPSRISLAQIPALHIESSLDCSYQMKDLETSCSGIEGQVMIRPISPVERPGVVNERPYQATITVLAQSGQVVTQFQSNKDGRFRVSLKPGIYILHPESPRPRPYAPEQAITVDKAGFTWIEINYDSGIR